jgi:uncharacterized protein YjbI with pentapeptide repeats
MLSKEELIELISSDKDAFNSEIKSSKGGVDITESDFSNLTLEGIVFDNTDLTSSSFSDTSLTNVKFDGCDLTSVDFTRATLIECSFNESVLNGTDFSYARIDFGNFSDADMAGSIFQSADLTNSDFSMSENLSACRFDEDTIWPDNEYLPEDFDTNYSSDLSSLKDDDDYEQSDY